MIIYGESKQISKEKTFRKQAVWLENIVIPWAPKNELFVTQEAILNLNVNLAIRGK